MFRVRLDREPDGRIPDVSYTAGDIVRQVVVQFVFLGAVLGLVWLAHETVAGRAHAGPDGHHCSNHHSAPPAATHPSRPVEAVPARPIPKRPVPAAHPEPLRHPTHTPHGHHPA